MPLSMLPILAASRRALPRLLLCALLTALAAPAMANEAGKAKADIAQAQKDIAELEKLIKQIQSEKSAAQQALQSTEKEIGELKKSINSLEGEQKKNHQEINSFEQEKKELESSRQQQQKLIAIQSRAAYQAGQSEPMRLMFNQQDPALVSHNLMYYQYLQQARQQQIKQFQATVRQLAELQTAIAEHQQELEQQKAQLLEQQEKLAKLHTQRKQQVQSLTSKQQGSEQKLASRRKDQAQLNNLLAAIEKKLARQAEEQRLQRQREQARERERQLALQQRQNSIRQQPGRAQTATGPSVSSQFSHPGGNFSRAKGKLPWPVDGRLVARFGSTRDDTRSKWDGVLIQAQEGQQVRAIHGGRVVFADWLRGSGLLVIVDHGDGYLSLYGHNQSLLTQAGATIKAGQAIATVGNTGGQNQSALYFAIRQQGRATDPNQWCRG